jgi:hypothetical protein
MLTQRKMFAVCALGVIAGLIAGCGSGSSGSGSHVANSVVMTVNSGPAGNATNTAYVDVQVCAPGTSNCTTITNVSVDTGSSGLRILASALGNVTLPQENASSGSPLVECAQFVSFITWGPMKMADIKMAGEVASNVPIQVIADPAFGTIPGNCSSNGVPVPAQTVQALGANGLLGVGNFAQDCGPGCASNTSNGFYYQCPTPSTCSETTATLTQQGQNPVWMFPSDNNGVVMQLPQIASSGTPSVTGTLIFGIGTQSDNGLGNATVFTITPDTGTFTTSYNGTAYAGSFIDSGSNGIFFLSTAETSLPECTNSMGFYCPAATTPESATNQGTNNNTNTVNFSIANADQLPAPNFAFNDIGGPNPGSFDWGLPFFFGRTVYTGIEGQNSPPFGQNSPPYWAY